MAVSLLGRLLVNMYESEFELNNKFVSFSDNICWYLVKPRDATSSVTSGIVHLDALTHSLYI